MIFILGIERSATTWLSTILDHHPRTDVYMEPLSYYISRFKDWPGRFEPMVNTKKQAASFKGEFEKLKTHRRFLFTRMDDSPAAWRRDLSAAQWLARKGWETDAIRDFLELNYHRKDRQISVKKEPPLRTVVKELRLNFQSAFISEIDPPVQVIISIREMASCVRSIMQQIEAGNLGELKQALSQYYGEISVETLACYWKESYGTLIETLQEKEISHRIVSHIDLLESPETVLEELLTFLDLSYTDSVQKYLAYSNQSGSGKHNTQRDRESLLRQMQRDREQIYPKVEETLKEIEADPVLKNHIHR